MTPRAVLALADQELEPMLQLLARLVEVNSHADHAAGVDACLAEVAPVLRALGFVVELVESEAPSSHPGAPPLRRRHLVADWAGAGSAAPRLPDATRPQVLLMGHLDTVFPADHPFQRLERAADRWRGPGVSDMKGGIVTALLTLRLLSRFGALALARWRMVLVTDEEEGSPTGAAVLERAAAGVDVALSFEAARACGGLVLARKGYGSARLVVRGRSGHAGIDHDQGSNALTALARFIAAAEALERDHDGLTVSPGGAVRVAPAQLSTIPDHAECELEWRFFEMEVGQAVQTALAGLAERIGREAGARLELTARIETPPMAATAQSRRLLDRYVSAARELGFEVRGVATAGVGDINQLAQRGTVCLDGVGPEGGNFHTVDEHLRVASVAPRAAMNVLALARYLAELPPPGAPR